MTAEFGSQRHLFSIPPDQIWLNNAYMGPIPIPAQRASRSGLFAYCWTDCRLGPNRDAAPA